MVAIVASNAAMGVFIWYMRLGGKFPNMLKLVGIAQRMKITNTIVKGIALLAKGFKFLVDMVMKTASEKNGKSWFNAIKKGLGVLYKTNIRCRIAHIKWCYIEQNSIVY